MSQKDSTDMRGPGSYFWLVCGMQKSWTRRLCKAGEIDARCHLQSAGYFILETNWRAGRYGEIDIIARDNGGQLIFLEVKARSKERRQQKSSAEAQQSAFCRGYKESLEGGLLSVNRLKQIKIVTTARRYLAWKGKEDFSCRFDVIVLEYSIAANDRLSGPIPLPEITWIKDAFTA